MNTEALNKFTELDSLLEQNEEINPTLSDFNSWNSSGQEAFLTMKEIEIAEQNQELDRLLGQYDVITEHDGELDEAISDQVAFIHYLRTKYAEYLNSYLKSTFVGI